jgi:predicted HD superfamily hydrolase involved in NAD metabolism
MNIFDLRGGFFVEIFKKGSEIGEISSFDEQMRRIEEKLQKSLGGRRFRHSQSVAREAKKLAAAYKISPQKAFAAGLLHDCAKEIQVSEAKKIIESVDKMDEIMARESKLLHQAAGAIVANREYGVIDEEILDAIRFHTTGKENMTKLGKIIYLADFIDPMRSSEISARVREIAYEDLDRALITAISKTISILLSKNSLIHPDTTSARNFLLLES